MGTVTEVLDELRRGSPGARDELFRLVYAELRRIADGYMRKESPQHTLQPTALVNETYLKLMAGADPRWSDRSEFLSAAARAMRRILVDFARTRKALKRGGDHVRVTFREEDRATRDRTEEILAVHDALSKLERLDAAKSRVVELHFFGGLSFSEAAKVMGVSERSLYRMWEQARAWLYREMSA